MSPEAPAPGDAQFTVGHLQSASKWYQSQMFDVNFVEDANPIISALLLIGKY